VGVIMALIGQKLIATPWYVDVAVILCLFAGTFLLMSLCYWWKHFSSPQRAVRLAGILLMLSSSITQIWIYHPGHEAAPVWFTPMVNGLLVLVAAAFIWAGWVIKPRKSEPNCELAK
jgi:ABC-type xylose transport system permease subunit